MSIGRVLSELRWMQNDPLEFFSAGPNDDFDLFAWSALITGPQDSPFEGGLFRLSIKFSPEHPFKPPQIKFITKVYHPNIDSNGSISLNILQDEWCPALTIKLVLLSIVVLLGHPYPDEPLVPEIALIYKNNISLYEKTAKEWTLKYAS